MDVFDSTLIGLVITVIFLLFCSAFFSGSETSLMSSSKPKLHKMSKEGDARAARVSHLTDDAESLLGTILLGNNLVNIAASAVTTGLFIRLFGESGIAIATLVMTFLVLIFAEILPKTIAAKDPERHALWIGKPMSFLVKILRPFTKGIQIIARGVMWLLRINANETRTFGEDDVRGAIGMGLEEGVLEKGEHRMLDAVLQLDELTVADVMIHRSRIEMINAATPVDDIYNQLAKKPSHSRLPVFEKDGDNIIGILLLKDFLTAYHAAEKSHHHLTLKEIIQAPYFVPENVALSSQLSEFRARRQHLALVVDEYGDLQGLLTLEDILEEIVGEIVDEHDAEEKLFEYHNDDTLTLAGNFPVRDINREFDWALPEDEDAVTLAGLMIDSIGHIPAVGEHVTIGNIELRAIVKKRQKLTKIRARILSKTVEKES